MLKFIFKISPNNNLKRLLTLVPSCNIHHSGAEMPRQYNFYWKPEHRKILYDKKARIIKMQQRQHYDILVLPGYNQQNIHELFLEYRKKKVNLSPENVAMLIHMFIKFNLMTNQIFDTIEKQAYKLKGQYKIRSIFGALRGSILFNRPNLIQFFIEQYKATQEKFTMHEMLQIFQALSKDRFCPNKQKLQIWEGFKPDFVDGLMNIRIKNVDVLSQIFDFLQKINEKDQSIWERVIKLMKYKKGWDMIPMFQRLYLISGQFESAKRQFDYYYQKMSADAKILERYNITQLKYKTPLEVIKYVQQNPTDYQPKIRTLVPEEYDANQWNLKYQQFLKVGSIKQQQQIIRDKSKSLGFAIKQRYQSLSADGLDFSKMNKQQFSQMFGDYDSAISTIKQAQQLLQRQQNQSAQGQQEQVKEQQSTQQQQEKENKKQKGKKEAKQGHKSEKVEKKEKGKKEKGSKEEKKEKEKKKQKEQ